MDAVHLIELTLEETLAPALAAGPAGLAAAIRDGVLPGGARVRPRLCLAVHAACGGQDEAAALSVAAAIELMHCASLVHDDLPCFDDATLRRGVASVHVTHGAALATLAGDALIVLAFETLARGVAHTPHLAALTVLLAGASGMPHGIVAGQGWEAEARVPLAAYHRAKTGALFALASEAGALIAGVAHAPWRRLGERLGEAYQIADDIRDATADSATLGKTAGRDATLDRPSAARTHGVEGALDRLQRLVAEATETIPLCAQADTLRALIRRELRRLLPADLLPADLLLRA